MAVPSDRNKIVKVFEKLSKCKDLEIKIAKMWKTGTYTTPVVIGALRVIKKGLKKCVENNSNISVQFILFPFINYSTKITCNYQAVEEAILLI